MMAESELRLKRENVLPQQPELRFPAESGMNFRPRMMVINTTSRITPLQYTTEVDAEIFEGAPAFHRRPRYTAEHGKCRTVLRHEHRADLIFMIFSAVRSGRAGQSISMLVVWNKAVFSIYS